MTRTKLEKDWTTLAGYRAVVILNNLGFRCGYVGVPREHPLHKVRYDQPHPSLTFRGDELIGKRGILSLITVREGRSNRPDIVFDVHGGLTFSNYVDHPDASWDGAGLWWFGYDCGHHGDKPAAPSPLLEVMGSIGGVARTLRYCEAECEALAFQLGDRVYFSPWRRAWLRLAEWMRTVLS